MLCFQPKWVIYFVFLCYFASMLIFEPVNLKPGVTSDLCSLRGFNSSLAFALRSHG